MLISVFYDFTKIVDGKLHGQECFDFLDGDRSVSSPIVVTIQITSPSVETVTSTIPIIIPAI